MRILFLMALLAPLPVQATELWCMPDTICRAGTCRDNSNTEASVRLHDPYGAAPVLRADAQDIAMTRTHEGKVVQWEGSNDFGRGQLLSMRRSDLAFVYLIRDGDTDLVKATGRCEVQ